MWSVTGVDDPADMDRYLQEKASKKRESRLCSSIRQFAIDLSQSRRECLPTSFKYIH